MNETNKHDSPEWQWSYESINYKLMYLYQNKHLSDVSFIVGKNAERISAHKFILVCYSSVFEAMFYGSIPEGDTVHLPDDEPSLFHLMLNHIYNEVQIESTKQALQLYAIADKYRIKNIMDNAEKFIESNLDIDDVLTVLRFAKLYDKEHLIKRGLQKWIENDSKILKSQSFLDTDLDLIEELFGMEELNINSEIELVEAFAKYVNKHNNDDEFNNYNKWRVLSKIRFLSIGPEEIAKCTALKSLISESDYCKIMDCILLSNPGDIPQYICKDQMRRGAKSYTVSMDDSILSGERKLLASDTIQIRVMFYQNSTILNFSFDYSETLKSISIALEDGKLLPYVPTERNDNITLTLNPPFFVERLKWKIIIIKHEKDSFVNVHVNRHSRHNFSYKSKEEKEPKCLLSEDLVLEFTENCYTPLNSMTYLK